MRPAIETSSVVSYGGKTILRWRTAAILKIDISPYISEKSSDFHEILYTAADFKLDERHVIKNKKSCIGQTANSTERISCYDKSHNVIILGGCYIHTSPLSSQCYRTAENVAAYRKKRKGKS